MAEEQEMTFPDLPVGQWWKLRNFFKGKLPGSINIEYLMSTLKISESTAKNTFRNLVLLGIIDKEGKTTERANHWRDDALYSQVCIDITENIYPEDIESIINNIKYVMESLVIQQKGRLVALVHLNTEELEDKLNHFRYEAAHQISDTIDHLLDEIKIYVNERVNKSSRLQAVILQPDPFERTPTLKIKRYLY